MSGGKAQGELRTRTNGSQWVNLCQVHCWQAAQGDGAHFWAGGGGGSLASPVEGSCPRAVICPEMVENQTKWGTCASVLL